MYHAPKRANNWRPTATIDALKQRAAFIANIRHFFYKRDILEVETPLLAYTSDPNPHLTSFKCKSEVDEENQYFYLPTSPEFYMKRLLASGSGNIFQITKAFRAKEQGRLHHIEFTLLEWYRLHYNHHQLMDEVESLLSTILKTDSSERFSYQAVFEHYLGINPHHIERATLQALAQTHIGQIAGTENMETDDILDLLFSHCIQPQLGLEQPSFIYDYPASKAMLARLADNRENQTALTPIIAQRFEIFIQGIELGNGFYELTDAQEQRRRFRSQQSLRQQKGLPVNPLDEQFLLSLTEGPLPDCSGVALGVDRLMLLAIGKQHLREVVTFIEHKTH